MYQNKEALSEVRTILEANNDFYSLAVLRGVYFKAPGGLKNALTKIILMKKGAEEKEPDEKIEYKDIVLVKKVIELEDFIIILEKLLCEELLMFDEYSCRIHITNLNKSHYPSNDFFDWPGELFAFESERPNISQYQPLVKYSNPLFKDAYHAIDKWIDLHPFHGNSDARLGAVLIFLPEYRARINNIRYQDGKLFVKADFNIPRFDNVRCKALITTSNGEEIQESVDFKNEEVNLFISSPPVNTHIYLVTAEDRTLDFYEETPFRHSGKVRFISKGEIAEVSDIQALIMGGENEFVEFKEKVKEEKTKKDLVKTAIAFANTKGGKIFIGVNDNAEIVGIDNEQKKNSRSKVKEKYDNILRDNAKKAFKFSTEFYKVSHKTILIIHVGEGEFKPYATRDNDTFIRVGATDRKPDPDTELPTLFPKQEKLYKR